ncbi:terminase small subunit [Sunxiuqinia indica]|uniref:terminase small subunit n=1 Tax=Sunxiuqinia indica TaxID=2692584 RepID=UPI00135A4BB3|nr:terminase small subunit [Sunxiuqinia indica]
MGAPKYNEYWKERKKHGRDKLFENPEEIIDLAQNYIEYCTNNPIIVKELIKSGPRGGDVVDIERPRIPSRKGFTVFLGIDGKTLWNYEKDEKYKDFFQSFAYVCDLFDSELTDNATTGQANPAIAAMLLGLKQKQDITSNDQTIKGVAMSRDEAKRINEDLEDSV